MTGIEAVPARFAEFERDPAMYVARFHGIPRSDLWSKQIEILESVRDHKYTAVPAGHNLSKTFTASLAVWWWKMCFRPSKVIVTAPGNRQAGLVIGNEIRARHDGLARRWSGPGEMEMFGIESAPNTEGWRQDADNFMAWFATTPDKAAEHATRMAGFHSPNMLFVFEEAAAIPKVIWESIQGSMLAGHARLLAIGNPSDPTSQFARFCRNPDVNVIRLDAAEFPNVVEDRVIFPWGPTKASIEELARYWGPGSGTVQWKIHGRFPSVATDTLIGYDVVMRAVGRPPKPCEHPPEALGLGCDVARFGDDRTTVIAVCGACDSLIAAEERHGQDTMETTGLVLATARAFGMNEDHGGQVAIDDTGVGGGVTDRCREQGWGVRAENFGAGPRRERNEVKFANRRTELWWTLREWITERACLATLEGRIRDELVDELTSPKYTHKSDSRVILEPKADIKKRIGRSPDWSDGLALAVSPLRRRGGHGVAPDPKKAMTPDDLEDEADDERNAQARRYGRKWGPLGDRLDGFNIGGRTDGGGWTPVE